MYVVSITRFPVSKGKEVGERFLEAAKKFPPDRTLEKEILRMAAKITGNEVVTIGVSEVKEGKYNKTKISKKIGQLKQMIKEISF